MACRLVDMLLGTLTEVQVDKKLLAEDRFDDLTTRGTSNHWERSQFKHTDEADVALSVNTFTIGRRNLRLKNLVADTVSFRDGPGADSSSVLFGVVLRNTPPIDAALANALVRADPDPGPFVAGMATTRLRFDAAKLAENSDEQARDFPNRALPRRRAHSPR